MPEFAKNPLFVPAGQAVSLVFDACALIGLANIHTRQGSTWLDLIYETAKLPTVSSIIIPSYIADWELRGGVTTCDRHGNIKFIRVDHQFGDPTHEKGKRDEEFQKLFKNASQWRKVAGEFRYIKGIEEKIIVVETESQYLMLREILSITGSGKHFEPHKMSKFWKNSIGEEAVEDIAQRAPFKGPVAIITNDIHYLVNRNLHKTTAVGYPISTAKDFEYVKAEFAARENDLKKTICPGGYFEFYNTMLAQWDEKMGRLPLMAPYRDPANNQYKATGEGIYFTSVGTVVKAEPLADTFKRGVAMLKGERVEHNYPAAARYSNVKGIWEKASNDDHMVGEKFRILRELTHILRYEVAGKVIQMLGENTEREISDIVDRISAFEAGTPVYEEEKILFEQGLKDAVIDRADNFIRVIAAYTPPSQIIKQKRQETNMSLDTLAERVVTLCKGKKFWQDKTSVKVILRAYEKDFAITRDPEKLNVLGIALGLVNGSCEEFVNLCLASHFNIDSTDRLKAQKQSDAINASRRDISYNGLTSYALENKESANEWSSILSLKNAVLKLADFGEHKAPEQKKAYSR